MTNSNSFFQNRRGKSSDKNTLSQSPPRQRDSALTTLEPMVLLSASYLELDPWDSAALDGPADVAQGATIFGTDGGDHIEALATDDVVFSEGGDDRVYGGDGADTLFGGEGDDKIYGGAGDDYIDGESGSDQIYAESGNDVIIVAGGQDVVDGGGGVDLVELYEATDTVRVDLTTGIITGGLTAQLHAVEGLLGSDQNDVFEFAAPVAGDVFYLHGSAGRDVLDLSGFGVGNTVQNGGHIQASVAGGVVDIYFAGVEDIVDAQGMQSAGVVDFWSLPAEYREMFAGFAEDAGPAPADVSPTFVDGVQTLDNYGPAAEDDFASVDEDHSVVIDVLSNDTDFDNDSLLVSSITVQPGQGTVAVNSDGMIVYTPQRDFYGLDQFTYEVSDGKGGFDTAVVTIDVLPVNDAPVAVNDAFLLKADEPMIVVGKLLNNDSDPDGDSLRVIAVNGDPEKVDVLTGMRTFSLEGGGRVNVYFDGTVMFDPAGDFDYLPLGQTQEVSFSYEVSDGHGGTSTATATVTVVGVNEGPEALADHFEVPADRGFAEVGNLLRNDSDPDGDPLRVIAVNGDPEKVDVLTGMRTFSLAGGGRVNVYFDGTVTFDPAGDFDYLPLGQTQEVSFSYEVSDGHGGTATETARITVVGKNQAPTTVGEHWWVEYNDAGRLGGLLYNDHDPDGDRLVIASVNGDAGKVDPGNGSRMFDLPEGGRLQVTADGQVTFDPAGDFNHLHAEQRQDVTFSYEVSDGRGGTATETARITVVGKNQAPTTVGEHWWVEYNDAGRLGGLLYNDHDPDGDPLVIASVNGDAGKVDPGNGSRMFDLPEGGRLQVTADGQVTFDPAGDFNYLHAEQRQDVTFSYEVSDGRGGTATETARITVVGKNQAPTTVGEHWWVEYNDAGRLGGLLYNDHDPDGDRLVIASVNGDAGKVDPGNGSRMFDLPEGGRLQVTADGQVTFDPAGDFNHLHAEQRQDVTFSYEVSDGRGGTATETARITVVGKNQAPTTVGEHWWVEYNDAGRLGGLLYNDHDPDGDRLVIASVNGDAGKVDPGNGSRMFDLPEGGRLQVTADGQVTFDPAGDFNHLHAEQRQDVTFSYEVSDGRGGTATETARITVVGKNQAPNAVNDLFYARSDQGFLSLGRLLANDSDADGDALTVTTVNGDAGKVDTLQGARTFDLDGGGRVNVYFDGNVMFDPAGDFNHLSSGQTQHVSFRYQVSDGRGGVSEATATIAVTGVNDGPRAVDDHFYARADQGFLSVGRLLANDHDSNGDRLTVVSVDGAAGRVDNLQGMRVYDLPGGGRVNVYFDGNVMFDPAGDFDHLLQGQTQDVQFTYEIADGRGGTSTATATVTVSGTRVQQAAPPTPAPAPVQNTGYAAGAAVGTGDNTQTTTTSHVGADGRQSASATSNSSGSNGATASSSAQSGRGSGGQGLNSYGGGDSNSFSETSEDGLTATTSGSNSTAMASNPFRSLFSW